MKKKAVPVLLVGGVIGAALWLLSSSFGLFGGGGDGDGTSEPAAESDAEPAQPTPDTGPVGDEIAVTTELRVGRDQVFAGERALTWPEVDAVITRAAREQLEIHVEVRGTAVEGTVAELRRRLEAGGVRYNVVSEQP
jgi:hypothetical protein